MLEGIPAAASGATQSYGDALAFAVIHADDDRDPEAYPRWRGFSTAVLFAATRRIWTTSTFTPSIAEVIKTAREVRADYYAALARTNRLLELRANARDVIADTRRVMCPDDLHEDDVPF
ncbi:hypothetical protein C5688_13730 [Methylocystis sp. MitZ-2018]|nr:hypothetical protein C5688_13730 [Methylocystis sp. MitZ-2018]